MPTETDYAEFADQLEALAKPLRAIFPSLAISKFLFPELGRPGIFISGRRPQAAKYPFPLSIFFRWSNSAIKEYVCSDADERKRLRESFAGNLPTILQNIEKSYGGVDWESRSQASARGIVVDLDDF